MQKSRHSQPYGYRDDTHISPFPDVGPVLFFDGDCVLRSTFARLVLTLDRHGRIRLAAAQSAMGQAIYSHYGLDPIEFETNQLVANGHAFRKSDSFIETMRCIGWPWSMVCVVRFIPHRWRDGLYDLFARNRYRIFGQHGQCMMPPPEFADRFLQ